MNNYRLSVIGSGAVGKSAITLQYISNHFVQEYDPTIEDSYRKQVVIDNVSYLLDILDTAGQEEYTCIRHHYMKDSHGFLLVFDITNKISFEDIEKFYKQIQEYKDTNNYIPIILCGNKYDLEINRQITNNEGIALANIYKCKYIEVSAKTRYNLELVWSELVREIVKSCQVKKTNKKLTKCTYL
jgi:GTPase KRas protein